MKILVIKFRHIGDVLLTTPLLDALRQNYPDATIDFACNKGTESMLELNPNINKIHVYDREKAKTGNFFERLFVEFKFIRSIKKEKYDIAIQTTSGDRGVIIAKYAKIKRIVAFLGKNKAVKKMITDPIILPNLNRPLHVIEQNMAILNTLGLKMPDKKCVNIYYPNSILSDIALPDKFIHFHFTSRWMFKCVNDEIMAEIIDFCQINIGIQAVITADKNEAEISKVLSVLSICKSIPINLSGKLSLKQVAALSDKASLFIGVDTAIMHIAAALNTPVIAFFGPSGAFEWGPWDNDVCQNEYTKRNGIQSMGRHTVIQHNMDCVPCGKDGCNGTKVSDCLMNFDLDIVKEKIKLISINF